MAISKNRHIYNGLYAKAQLMASDDEFRVRCREAYETKQITEDEYKELLAFRKSIHGDNSGKPTDASIQTGVKN